MVEKMNIKDQTISNHKLIGATLSAFELGYNLGIAMKTREYQEILAICGTINCCGCETGKVTMFVKSKLCFACLHRGEK